MFDSLTAAALADQLTRDVEPGRVQNVGLISRQAIWLEIYARGRRKYLIASAESQSASVYLTANEPVSDRQLVTPLLLLLRKYVRGSRLVSIQQPPLERHLTLTFGMKLVPDHPTPVQEPIAIQREDDDDDEDESDDDIVFTHLHLEIMGRHSNLILVSDDGLIMESAKRVSLEMSRVRPISPKRPYVPPPVQDKADPRRATEAELSALLSSNHPDKNFHRVLTGHFRGLSPQIAREAIARSTGADGSVSAADLSRELRFLFEPLLTDTWEPTVYRDSDGIAVAYAPVPLQSLAVDLTAEPAASISAAIEIIDGSTTPATEAGKHAIRTQRLTASIRDSLERLDARARSLEGEVTRHENRDQLRQWGELIFGYMWQIKPGDRELVVDEVRIPLDPSLSPSEQARDYMDRYQHAKSSDTQISNAREELENRRQYLGQLLTLASQARSIQDVEELEQEWHASQPEQSRGKSPRRSTGKKRTLPTEVVRDQPIYIGHSGAENDRVTFDIGGPDDTWLHARGVPGSHVIVKWTPGVRDNDEVILRAAELAAFFSQSRESGRVEVDITERRHVRKIKGGGPGMVTYRNERTVSVAPVGPR